MIDFVSKESWDRFVSLIGSKEDYENKEIRVTRIRGLRKMEHDIRTSYFNYLMVEDLHIAFDTDKDGRACDCYLVDESKVPKEKRFVDKQSIADRWYRIADKFWIELPDEKQLKLWEDEIPDDRPGLLTKLPERWLKDDIDVGNSKRQRLTVGDAIYGTVNVE